MTGERRIPASREKVWAALNDPEVLRGCIPGCDSFERTGPDAYKASAGVKIGPIAARFTGAVKMTDVEPPSAYTITGEGQGGVAGFAKGGAKVHLDDEAGATLLTYEVSAQVGGKIAQLGARLIDASAKQMADQFFDRFTSALSLGGVQPPMATLTTDEVPPPATFSTPPANISVFSLIPSEIFGLPIVAWIGIAIFLPIFFLIFSAYL